MMLEADVLREVLAEFAGDPRIRIWRAAVGRVQTPTGVWVSFGQPGQADLSGIIVGSGKRLEIEVKRPGGRLRARQAAFGEAIRRAGGVYAVVTSAGEARAAVEPHLMPILPEA